MNEADVRTGFVAAGMPAELGDEVLEGYAEAKRRYHLGDHRPTAVEGGRFCEAITRVLEHELLGAYTKLGRTLPPLNDKRLREFAQAQNPNESLRRHIPKALYFVYGIRNTRDIAHLADGIDPNLQDATLVVTTLDWMMAELVRIYHTVSPDEAHAIITDLVTREVPVIEEIAGHPVLNKNLSRGDHILVLLYRAGQQDGLDYRALLSQMRTNRKDHLKQALSRLESKHLVHADHTGERAYITTPGIKHVENKGLLAPA